VKIFLTIIGIISLGLAIAGVFLPLLPTTPLLLLSAWCFFRSSPRLYEWLLNHPRLGEYIRNFREHKAIPLRVKIVSVSLLWLTLGYCIIFIAEQWWLRSLLLGLAIAITWHILSYATLRKRSGDCNSQKKV
jgi:uncharacterized membrane protein YbaN (DUF454 family)